MSELKSEKLYLDLSEAIIVIVSESPVCRNAAEMLCDEIDSRTRIDLEIGTEIALDDWAVIVVGTVDELEMRSFSTPIDLDVSEVPDACAVWIDEITRSAPTVCVAGYDDRGVLFAVGQLLRQLEMSRDAVSASKSISIATKPTYSLRGHQLGYRPKTNSYDGWTLAMWEQYYRDLIVFGANAVELIPPRTDDDLDSPHFPRPPLRMMIDMSQLAVDYGLDVWIWFPAIDEDYTDEKTYRDALEEWEIIFRSLPKIDVVFVPGGDPGETHPSILMPFIARQKETLNQYHPDAQIWVSPQVFDWRGKKEGWLKAFLDIVKNELPDWLDGIVFGPEVAIGLPELREEIPDRYPIRRYPDITHTAGGRWAKSHDNALEYWDRAFESTHGREPINPRPQAYARIFRDLQHYSIGALTYSEGCNDDVNKAVWSMLGWDPETEVSEILRQYSRYFISNRFEDRFAEGLAGLERNWDGPLSENDGVYATLEIFQEMEREATPQEKLNWRFQQGLYRAYYDAYIKARLEYETRLENEARKVLKSAPRIGSLEALDEAEGILVQAETQRVRPEWRARIFELAEALFQSIRMQLSVPLYKAISVIRGATLDTVDEPLNEAPALFKGFERIRMIETENERIKAIQELIG